jgi:hypothetical protein
MAQNGRVLLVISLLALHPSRSLVWPQTLGWRWGPSWDRQRAAAAGGGAALAAGEAQRRRQLPAPLGVLLVEVVAADLEPRYRTACTACLFCTARKAGAAFPASVGFSSTRQNSFLSSPQQLGS